MMMMESKRQTDRLPAAPIMITCSPSLSFLLCYAIHFISFVSLWNHLSRRHAASPSSWPDEHLNFDEDSSKQQQKLKIFSDFDEDDDEDDLDVLV